MQSVEASVTLGDESLAGEYGLRGMLQAIEAAEPEVPYAGSESAEPLPLVEQVESVLSDLKPI